MKTKIFLFAILAPAISCFSQNVAPYLINNSGGSFQKNSYQIEWSIGELALVNQMNARQNNLIITNGFLQPFTLNPANFSTAVVFDANEVKILPNPASSYVDVNFFTKQKGKVTLCFYDAAGKNVYTQQVNCYGVDLIQRIPLGGLAAGTYMLHITLDSFYSFASNSNLSKKGVYKIVVIR